MERLIAITNWRSPGRASKLLQEMLGSSPPNQSNVIPPEFCCASSLTTNCPNIFSDKKGFQIVCDARIDNRLEILEALPGLFDLCDLSKISDAQIILAAYRKWGKEAAGKLIGDFCFVIWNNADKSLYAARDAMSMRTLYYAKVGLDLCLASDTQSLLQHPRLKAEVNRSRLTAWISGWPDPDASMFQNIEAVPAGHYLCATFDYFSIERYWDIDPDFKLYYQRPEEYEEHLYDLLGRCVNDRLRTNAKLIATQMSGGMDSTSVTAIANKSLQSQDPSLMVISHSYTFNESCDESDRIKEMSQHLHLNNAHILPTDNYLNLDFHALYPPSLESPGTVLSPRYIDEIKLIKNAGVDVLLSGSGGDEMCWGHSLSYSQRLKKGNLKVIPEVVASCRELQLPVAHTLFDLFAKPLVPQTMKTMINKTLRRQTGPLFPDWVPAWSSNQFMQELETIESRAPYFNNPALQARYKALRNSSTFNSVRSYQRVGAQYGIDVRHPFFDRRLAEFSFAIPDSLWIRGSYPKWLLRKSMDKMLPTSVCWNKQKVIFNTFFSNILKSQASNIREILSDTRLQEMRLIDNRKTLAAFDATIANSQASLTVDLLYVLLTQIWFQRHCGHFEGWS